MYNVFNKALHSFYLNHWIQDKRIFYVFYAVPEQKNTNVKKPVALL
jgi:hypothetical protein